jgi:phosphatidylinositol-3-phosphatase
MTPNKDRSPISQPTQPNREHCAGCDSALVEDQRYCLRCGARRGRPRVDFTAFWKPLSPTGQPGERRAYRADERPEIGAATVLAWLDAVRPSRGLTGLLAAGVLTIGVVVGVALGPGPSRSTADSSTLAQRVLATLVARTDTIGAPATAPTSPETTPSKTATTSSTPTASGHNAKFRSSSPSSEASSSPSSEAPTPSSSDGASSKEPSLGAPSAESEGSSKASSKGSSEAEKVIPGTPIKLPPIKHVWLITLSGESLSAALADPASSPYLAKQIAPKGTLLNGYKLTASSALGNGIALLSGQSANLDTEQNCPTYTDLQPPTVNATNGLAEGVGCLYPAAVETLPDELTAAGLTWRAYAQGMQASAGATTCRHPESGAPDTTQAPTTAGEPYLTPRNPFVYFHSLLDSGACASDDVDFRRLQGDLATPANTPSLSWIVPSACNDGSTTQCGPSASAGPSPADSFLAEVVPQILATSAYRQAGLIAIVPDSAPASAGDASTKPVGALLISPFVRNDAQVSENLNDFSLLKSLTRLFGVLPLGHAQDPSTVSFGATVYGTSGKAAAGAATAKKAAQAASTPQPRHQPVSSGG